MAKSKRPNNRAIRLKRLLRTGWFSPWSIMEHCNTVKYTNAISELRDMGTRIRRKVVNGVPYYRVSHE